MALNTFDDYRAKISIAEMAEYLGYWQDRSAGVGKTITYCLGNKDKPSEEIIIYPSKQSYWNRYGGNEDKGNLINFVMNRLDRFNATEKGFKGVNEVLSKYLNNPQTTVRSQQSKTSQPIPKDFNIHYWDPQPLKAGNSYLIDRRKISSKTVDDFRNILSVYSVGKNNHVGFPYRTWPAMEINNFEMRNYFEDGQNYKGFPAGGNRATSCWSATFVPDTQITDIYVFESAIDALSFYEIKNFTPETTAAFISTGGSITQGQINPLLQRFPKTATWHSCMDNDASGNIFDVSLAHYLKGEDFRGYANRVPEVEGKMIHLTLGDEKEITMHEDYFSSSKFLKDNNINNLDIIKPGNRKDWNELLIYYKRFDLNLAPDAKISKAIKETLSQLNLRGYHQLTSSIEKVMPEVISNIIVGTHYPISTTIAENGIHSMVMECDLKMKYAEFIVEPTAIHFVDKSNQLKMSGQPFRDSLAKVNVNLLRDFHSDNLLNFMEKNKLSVFKGGGEKSFEKVISPSGWGLKESTLLKKNNLDLDNSL